MTPSMLSTSIIFLLAAGAVRSFTAVHAPTRFSGIDFSLWSSSQLSQDQGNKKPLTAADILSRSRKAVGMTSEDESDTGPVLLFDDILLQDIQKTLLTLEKRVKNGPGSLSKEEIKDLSAASIRIINDMKNYRPVTKNAVAENQSQPSKATVAASVLPNTRDGESEDIFSPYTVAPHFSKQSPYEQPEEADAHALVDSVMKRTTEKDDDESEDGPKYNGRGGFGMAAGTRNTYFIPGMEEMSPEEYREALQKSVSDRQAMRKQRGIVGNLSSQSYLDQLGNR